MIQRTKPALLVILMAFLWMWGCKTVPSEKAEPDERLPIEQVSPNNIEPVAQETPDTQETENSDSRNQPPHDIPQPQLMVESEPEQNIEDIPLPVLEDYHYPENTPGALLLAKIREEYLPLESLLTDLPRPFSNEAVIEAIVLAADECSLDDRNLFSKCESEDVLRDMEDFVQDVYQIAVNDRLYLQLLQHPNPSVRIATVSYLPTETYRYGIATPANRRLIAALFARETDIRVQAAMIETSFDVSFHNYNDTNLNSSSITHKHVKLLAYDKGEFNPYMDDFIIDAIFSSLLRTDIDTKRVDNTMAVLSFFQV